VAVRPRLLAVVTASDQAAAAVEAGADRIAVAVEQAGDAMGDKLRAIRAAIADRLPISLLLPAQVTVTSDELGALAMASGAEALLLSAESLPAGQDRQEPIAVLVPASGGAGSAALVPNIAGVIVLVEAKSPGPAVTPSLLRALDSWQQVCTGRQLPLSVVGAFELPDIPRLLPLRPVELGLLAADGDSGPSFAARLRATRAMLETVSGPGLKPLPHARPDQIFLRDWVLPISIGVYAHEHEAPQRVRFSVDVEVVRVTAPARDLRNVVSYDLITDTIRRLTVEHVDLVETLAERIAEAILAHPRVLQVTVTIEKLDLGPGSLGCRIVRDKAG
jgi:dihydroneopterin aldolase